MRLNKAIALATGLSRRAADNAIAAGRVRVNTAAATLGTRIDEQATVTLDGKPITVPTDVAPITVMLNKPVGYVASRNGQGSPTIYDLLPPQYQPLKSIGRLDKDSSGLLLLTNDGQLAFELTHPSKQKNKVYEVTLNKPLAPLHHQMIVDHGIMLDDGPSKLQLDRLHDHDALAWQVTMHEGRNRQIRRTFTTLGYEVTALHRTQFGPYALDGVPLASWAAISSGQ